MENRLIKLIEEIKLITNGMKQTLKSIDSKLGSIEKKLPKEPVKFNLQS